MLGRNSKIGSIKYLNNIIPIFYFSLFNLLLFRRILLLLDVDIVAPGSQVGDQIGNPVQLTEAKKNESSSTDNGTAQKQSSYSTNSTRSSNTSSSTVPFGGSNIGTSLEGQMIHPISSLSPYQNR